MKEKEVEGTEAKPTELEAVSEFSKHFKTVMKEREKEKTVETKTKTETKTETPVVEEKVVEEPEEEEDDVMGEEQNISVGLGGILSMLQSQKSEDLDEESYGRRTDRVIRDDDNKGGCGEWL